MSVAAASILGGCSISVVPLEVVATDVVVSRTVSTIGPEATSPRVWRRVRIAINKSDLRPLERADATLRVEFSNCAGEALWVDEPYVGELSLDRLRFLSAAEFQKLAAAWPDRVSAHTYLPDEIFRSEPRICAKLTGGTMLGVRVTSRDATIKP